MVAPEAHSLGRHLKRLREARELSQEALAFASGVSGSMIAKLEQGVKAGKDPKLSTLMGLARGLDLTLLELIAELFPEQRRRKGR